METEQQAEESHPIVHTYDADLANAMDATDATTVQTLLDTAREKEAAQIDGIQKEKQKNFYSIFSFLFIVLAIAGAAYSYYRYTRLTVPSVQSASVGVFPLHTPIVSKDTDIRQTISALTQESGLPEGKPTLVPLVTDAATLSDLSVNDFFSFIEAKPTEPFAANISIIKLGVMNTGAAISPFVIMSVPDSVVASKEFLIAEPQLLQWFYRPLNIDLAAYAQEIGKGFTSEFMYNLPVRTLRTKDAAGKSQLVFLYGYATEHTIVLTTDPSVLKAVYDTIIRQQ